MSGAIRETEKLNQRQIETSKRRNERDLKKMEDVHQNLRADLRKTQNEEIIDIQGQHHVQIDKEAQKKEKVLSEMRDHLQQTRNLTDQELKSLKNISETETIETQKKLSADRERVSSENELFLEDLNHRFNQSAQKISREGKKRTEDMKDQKRAEYVDLEQFHDQKIQNQTEEFTTRFRNDTNNYKHLKDNQDNQFKKERLFTNQRQQIEMGKMTTQHNDHIEQKDGEYRKGLNEQELFFEKKYGNQLTRHTTEFKTLEEKNQKVIDGLKTTLTSEIKKAADRNDDPFFKFETLKPKLKNFEDRVEITVDVPEHSKQDLQLTTNGKEAVLTFNRRFADAAKEVDGTINKINKVETFTTRIQTGYFLDSKNLKSSYDDGEMTYVIKKA
jgi:hypothetical protein